MLTCRINTTKNLLAFSGGIDSTALFFLLLEQNIPFDIAIINYNIREQAKEEVAYAQELAMKYNKQCFVKEVTITSNGNFEKKARDIRYSFFEKIISEHSYKTLLTAHQLDDCLEWFLMQLSKGAGLVELLGLQELEQKEQYTLCRPLLKTAKDELQSYLNEHHITYFIDESNKDLKHTRNKIRHQFSASFLNQYKEGIQRSFDYLRKDLESLEIEYSPIFRYKEFALFQTSRSDNLNIRIIDKELKRQGILLSKAQRDEILDKKELVLSHKMAISLKENKIWITPYSTAVMDKKFKEKCRILKIPKNIRSYLFSIDFDLKNLTV